MSKVILVTTNRVNDSTPILSNLRLQLDTHAIPDEVLYYEGVARKEVYDAYTLSGVLDIRQTDILTETSNLDPGGSSVDPVTSSNYQYRVISIPAFFPDGHGEFTVDLLRGGV